MYSGLCLLQMTLANILTALMGRAVFERYPNLKIAFGESGIGWIPYVLVFTSQTAFPFPWALAAAPSDQRGNETNHGALVGGDRRRQGRGGDLPIEGFAEGGRVKSLRLGEALSAGRVRAGLQVGEDVVDG